MEQGANAFLRIEKLAKGKIEGHEQWDEIPLGTDAVLIARPSKKTDAIQPDIRIVGDDYVSRNYAEIYYSYSDGSFMLRDNGSTNGTFVREEPSAKEEQLETNKPYPH